MHSKRAKKAASVIAACAASSALPGLAAAEVPQVATDIAPIHSLVAQVMGDLGEPSLVVQPGASPHGYSLRPSEAQSLQSADLIVWVGEDLTPWLEGPVETLGEGARHLALMETEGTLLLEFREGATFEAHDHDHEEHAEGEHDHDHDHEEHAEGEHDHDHDHEEHAEAEHAHDDHDHEEHAEAGHDHDDHAHEEHAEAEHSHDDHDHAHGAHDPHVWLHPDNAKLWVGAIAATLSEIDPENADTYAANAAAATEGLTALEAEITETLAAAQDVGFIVFHDAYQYFETAFDVPAAGAISISDATAPSAARLTEVRGKIAELDAVCIGAEPQFDPRLVETVAEGTGAITVVMDPLGVELETGPTLYGDVLRNLADALATCGAQS